MSSAADAIRDFVAQVLGDGWRVQFGQWKDDSKTSRYAVVKPVGGMPASLVREPQFTLFLIGATGEEAQVPFSAADQVIEAMRSSSGELVHMQAAEASFHPTTDGRAACELAVSAITN